MNPNIPLTEKKRIVIVGGGFAGLKTAIELKNSNFQVVLLDKNNFHQFQPLLYQVATAGLEPSAIAFPFRKIFQNYKNFHFRETTVLKINHEIKTLETTIGQITYDELIIATGTDTNFYKIQSLIDHAVPMKSVAESLKIRNLILENFEYAMVSENEEELDLNLDIVIVGGGPTGVELAGAISEMRNHILPKDYPEIDFSKMDIYLIESGDRVLASMKSKSSNKALKYLQQLNVQVLLNTSVKEYQNKSVILSNNTEIKTKMLIWAAGVTANKINGLPEMAFHQSGRLIVNNLNQVLNCPHVYAIGDNSIIIDEKYPRGHPQVAQVAIQQANNLAKNIKKNTQNAFVYKDKGSMATIGRNLAVVDLPKFSFGGILAWLVWMFVHLMAIVGVKNKFFIFISWSVSYFTKDQSLRLIIRPKNIFKI